MGKEVRYLYSGTCTVVLVRWYLYGGTGTEGTSMDVLH